MLITGQATGDEQNKVQFTLGYDPSLPIPGPIPEPGTLLLLGSGFLGLGFIGWYRKRRA